MTAQAQTVLVVEDESSIATNDAIEDSSSTTNTVCAWAVMASG